MADDLGREMDALGVAGGDHRFRVEHPSGAAPTVNSRVRIVAPIATGSGAALRTGLEAARGEYIMTVDSESAGAGPAVQRSLDCPRRRRNHCRLPVCRRSADKDVDPRWLASRGMNAAFGRGLSLPVTDLSSPFQLYRADVLREQRLSAHDYDLEAGDPRSRPCRRMVRLRDPVARRPVRRDRSLTPLVRLGARYARTFGALWKLRNSIQAGDYDARAHDSRIPLQRYWQRQRFKHITELMRVRGRSSTLAADRARSSARCRRAASARRAARTSSATPGAIEAARARLRVRAAVPGRLVSLRGVLAGDRARAEGLADPGELCRVLAPGGRLVLGTPDYARWEWVYTEKAYGFFKPGGYADEHIAHYTRAGLEAHFAGLGYVLEATRYILRGELILAFRKPRL